MELQGGYRAGQNDHVLNLAQPLRNEDAGAGYLSQKVAFAWPRSSRITTIV
jgi:hypothetical protein